MTSARRPGLLAVGRREKMTAKSQASATHVAGARRRHAFSFCWWRPASGASNKTCAIALFRMLRSLAQGHTAARPHRAAVCPMGEKGIRSLCCIAVRKRGGCPNRSCHPAQTPRNVCPLVFLSFRHVFDSVLTIVSKWSRVVMKHAKTLRVLTFGLLREVDVRMVGS